MSCGKVVGSAWEEFDERVGAGEDAGDVMDDLGLTRYCCRRQILAHEDVLDDVSSLY